MRYNGFLSADINGGAGARLLVRRRRRRRSSASPPRRCRRASSFEWTELTYQEILAGNSALLVFPLAILLVFLVLAALYESLTLPLSIIMIVPMGLLAAMTGVWLTDGDNNIFTQIGLIVLVGLSAKNAILIVEFARELEFAGRTPSQAAIEASRLRLRPILMTSLAFIMGVVPLVFSTGAGAEMRHAMGVAVFAGMIGVTAFGIFLTPVFYVLLRRLTGNRPLKQHGAPENFEGFAGAQQAVPSRSTVPDFLSIGTNLEGSAVRVEEIRVLGIDPERQPRTLCQVAPARRDDGERFASGSAHIDVGGPAQILDELGGDFERKRRGIFERQMLGTQAKRHLVAWLEGVRAARRQLRPAGSQRGMGQGDPALLGGGNGGVDEVHLGRADEAGDEWSGDFS